MQSLNAAIVWYAYLLVIGLICMPFTVRIFGSWYDKGYPFSKTIGILVLSYAMFLVGTIRLLPFTQESLILLVIIIGVVSFRGFKQKSANVITKLSLGQWSMVIGEEIVFFGALLFLFFMRGQEPSIHGLEKFMDYGFMQSIGRSRYFPPLDMWFSADPTRPNGYPINYYYFGHLTGALLTKLTAIPSSVSYNLILATIFAQGVTLAFSWTYNAAYLLGIRSQRAFSRTKLLIAGVLGSILVNFAGNLHTIYIFTKGYENDKPIPICNFLFNWWNESQAGGFLGKSFTDCTAFQSIENIQETMLKNGTDFFQAMISNSKYWYPNATRFIPFTIHEFPSYSYVVADLHGHVFDIPFVILTLALILTFFTTNSPPDANHAPHRINANNLYGLMNQLKRKWCEFNSYAKLSLPEMVWTTAFGAMIAVHYMTNAFDGPIYILLVTGLFFYRYRLTAAFFLHTILLGFSYLVFSLPFSHAFTPFVSGIGVNCSPELLVKIQKLGPFLFEKGNCQSSPLWMMFTLWGFFLLMFCLFILMIYLQYGLKNGVSKHLQKTDWIVGILFIFGFFLITIPEFVYIKDIYPAHFRANTMFKLGYQAYIMMSMSAGYVLYRILVWDRLKKYILIAIAVGPIALVSIYSYFAYPSYYPNLNLDETYKSFPSGDGTLWVQNQYPYASELINYLNTQVIGQPVILEAQGDSYTDFNLISSYTGLPTVAGWGVHEWLWRGSWDVIKFRIPDISALYESEDISQTKDLLKKYHISYVIIGPKEREQYTHLNEKKFTKIGVKIFESSDRLGALYRIN